MERLRHEMQPPTHHSSLITHHSEERRLVLAMATSVAFAVTGGSMIAVALPSMGADFEAGPARLAWVATGFSVTFAIAAAWYGRLADRFGLRACFILGILLWAVGAGLAAISPTLELVVAGRLVQGLGMGAVPTLGRVAIARALPPQRSGAAIGTFMGAVGVGSSIGPLLGGVLVATWGWRAAIGFPVVALALLPVIPGTVPAGGNRSHHLDAVGALLLALAAGSIVAGLSLMRQVGLAHPGFYGLILVGLASVAAVHYWARHNPRSFAPAAVLANGRLRRLSVASSLGMAANIGSIILIPQAMVRGAGLGAAEVGLLLLPQAIAVAICSPIAGRLGDRFGHLPLARGGLLLAALAYLIISSVGPGEAPVLVGLLLVVAGVGASGFGSTLSARATQVVPPNLVGSAIGLFNLALFAGGAAGVAIGSALAELPVRINPLYAGSLEGFSSALLALAAGAALGAAVLPRGSGARG